MKINNLDFNVQASGQGEAFLWSHGLLSSIEAEDALGWMQWYDFPLSVRLVRYDARGHGRSEASDEPEDYHYRNLGQDMLALADAAGAGRFIAGGGSMGCGTALYAALAAPGRVKALVLMTPGTAWETRAAQANLLGRAARIGGLFGGKAMAKMVDRSMGKSLPAWLAEAEPEKIPVLSIGLQTLGGKALRTIFQGAGLSDLPPKQAFPALAGIPAIIFGWEGDPTHPVSTAQELHRLLPQSELFIARGYEEFKTIPERMRKFVAAYS
jgi:3-oxoadipate enol-lactonase